MQVFVPRGQPLDVSVYLYGQDAWCVLDEWQSNGQLLLLPAE
ncbi:hypothetical protein ACFVUY_15635 [Kitasatospora sp. NPDC058063]